MQIEVHIGGERHAGWLPDGSVTPPVTPETCVRLEVTLRYDGQGYLLSWAPAGSESVDPEPPYVGDLWFEDEDSALKSAREYFDVPW